MDVNTITSRRNVAAFDAVLWLALRYDFFATLCCVVCNTTLPKFASCWVNVLVYPRRVGVLGCGVVFPRSACDFVSFSFRKYTEIILT